MIAGFYCADMARWYTSDHHFGHRNIIGYCDRPFAGTDEMNAAMVERWNDLVGDDDEVWVIGDIALRDLQTMLVEHVARLRGRKILVPGNHDRCWAGRGKHDRSRGVYLELGGFERIVDAPKPARIGRKKVRISHFPYLLDESYDLKYLDHRPRDDGSWLLHGHIHEKWRQRGRQINVGVDAWDFRPAPEDTIAHLIAHGPTDWDPMPHQTTSSLRQD